VNLSSLSVQHSALSPRSSIRETAAVNYGNQPALQPVIAETANGYKLNQTAGISQDQAVKRAQEEPVGVEKVGVYPY